MIRIWAKLETEEKVVKSIIYDDKINLSKQNFDEVIQKICEVLDEPCPVILSRHFSNFNQFNTVIFKSADFIEEFKHDKLVLENAIIE